MKELGLNAAKLVKEPTNFLLSIIIALMIFIYSTEIKRNDELKQSIDEMVKESRYKEMLDHSQNLKLENHEGRITYTEKELKALTEARKGTNGRY